MLQYNSWYTYFDDLYLGHPSFESHKGTLLIETQCLFVFHGLCAIFLFLIVSRPRMRGMQLISQCEG
jgi:hypothetical protein